jgi:glycosyltransferase involved in cell wall biosynthesis
MRIGLLIYGLDRPLTGTGRYTLELVRALSAILPPSDVVLLGAGDLGPLSGATPFPCVRLPGCRLLPALISFGNAVLYRIARRLELDVIHALAGLPPFLFFGGRRHTVITIHDVFAWSIPGYSSLLDTLIYRYWLPLIGKRADAIITVSTQSKQDILRYLAPPADRLHIIPYGVTGRFQPQPRAQARAHVQQRFDLSQPYILYVGALTNRKNIARALEAFALIHSHIPDYQFVLAGPRSWKPTPIEALIQQLCIADRVHWTGPLTDTDLPALYTAAELFIFPSLYEGFGLPVIEAMACGTPVITSSVSSLPEVAGDAALLVDPYNIQSIADAMRQVIENPAVAMDLREKGLQRAGLFTWERAARETLAVYEGIMQS